ncbi:MAG: alcohol dehydrogenase catalytic domain-containing protein, partial [Elusimicrobia bacterium]|nr:alcohol dehydrogenase catalytic domain-containing protein [Elusimicrobiota bacterium]
MRALAAFPTEKKLRVIDAPAPKIERPTQVRLKVLEVGVCGTDKEIASFGYGFPPEGSDHLVMGHESLMEVVEAGPEAGGLKPGQLAVLTVRRPCPDASCKACRADRQDFCETGKFKERGINQLHGYMAEEVVDEAKYVVPLAPGLRGFGVLTEPTTIAEKGLEELDRIQARLPWKAGHTPTAVVLGA